MRIFLSSLLVLAHPLCLSLPTIGAALDGGSTDTDVSVNSEEGSGGRVLAALFSSAAFLIPAFGAPDTTGSWASFLSSSHIIESLQNATSALVTPNPSSLDFWETAKEYESLLQDYVPSLLGDAAEFFQSTNFTDITTSMQAIVNCTATFRDNIKDALDARNITFETFTEELEGVFTGIMNDLENIPPPDKAPSHAERAEMVDKVLDDAAVALINLATRYGIEEEVVTSYLIALKPLVQALIVTVGDFKGQYPDFFWFLVFIIVLLLIPQSWILGPLLRVFGFGPLGPVKGSAAAWAQRYFFGAAVKSGSWFSLFQKAAMTGVYPKLAGFLVKAPWIGGLLAKFFAQS